MDLKRLTAVFGAAIMLAFLGVTGAGCATRADAAEGEDELPPNAIKSIGVTRSETNPLITPASSDTLGENINYPSVIKVPDWVQDPLGDYYMYFGSHVGKYVRLAYADDPLGPWKVYEPGCLHHADTPAFPRHKASPDVHVDEEEKIIRMYFHGLPANVAQRSGLAHSKDGLNFKGSGQFITTNYFRRFQWEGIYYAIAGSGTSMLVRSDSPDTPFERVKRLARMRHSAVLVRGHHALVFYTRIGDAPERIFVSTVDLRPEPEQWELSEPIEVLRPETEYEGAGYELKPSKGGPATGVRQLHDPYVFEDDGQLYLYYSIAGESGIAVATMEIEMK